MVAVHCFQSELAQNNCVKLCTSTVFSFFLPSFIFPCNVFVISPYRFNKKSNVRQDESANIRLGLRQTVNRNYVERSGIANYKGRGKLRNYSGHLLGFVT